MRAFTRGALAAAVAAVTALTCAAPAQAHQPVRLTAQDSTPGRGPLLVDGTVSYAVYADLAERGEKRGFRFRMAAGEPLRVQVLIKDERPANGLAEGRLPKVVIVAPDGSRTAMRITERTPFYEPYSGTAFLYLSRLSATAQAGTYQVWIRSRADAQVPLVVAVGYREVPGEVR